MVHLRSALEQLRASLWFLPGLFAVGAVIASVALVRIDTAFPDIGSSPFAFGGTPEGARNILSTIAQSMLTFTGLVFSITMLVLQLASSQLSPRVMRTFLRDRGNQIVLGLFIATFVFTLLALRAVRGRSGDVDTFVPSLTIWVAFSLLLGSVAAFIYYIDHMAHAIRASTVIENIWHESVAAIERLYPERVGADPGDEEPTFAVDGADPSSTVVKSPRAGILVGIDEEQLLRAADEGDRRLELVPAVGDFVAWDAPLARLWGDWDAAATDRIRSSVELASERTLEQDAAFGLRQLVDVAVRALSPGTNDPTTAVQAIDRIHDLLRRLARRHFPSPRRSADGTVRLVLHRPDWSDYVRLGFDEIRVAGEGQFQIARRLRAVLADLDSIVPSSRRAILREERERLDASVERAFTDRRDRAVATEPSLRGHAMGTVRDER